VDHSDAYGGYESDTGRGGQHACDHHRGASRGYTHGASSGYTYRDADSYPSGRRGDFAAAESDSHRDFW
jgi:hypothetical protein